MFYNFFQAVMDDIISRNVASGERLYAPKFKPKEAAFLDEKQVTNVIALLENDRLFTTDDGNPMNPDSLTDYVNKFVHKHNLPKV
jgi:RPA family protein